MATIRDDLLVSKKCGTRLDLERLANITLVFALIHLVYTFEVFVAVGVVRIYGWRAKEALLLHPLIVEYLAKVAATMIWEEHDYHIFRFELAANFEYAFESGAA